MSSIPSIRSTPSIDLLGRGAIGSRKTALPNKGPLSVPTQQGLSLANPTSDTEQARSKGGENGDQVAQARKAAEGLVSNTFIEPILKQIRESNDAPPPFGPTQAEKQFGALLDTKVADEIVQGTNFPIVEQITQRLLSYTPAGQPIVDLHNPQQGIDTEA
ncbi:MAG: hypothetical protein ACWA5W_05270 [Phycisphaerales bacterium]